MSIKYKGQTVASVGGGGTPFTTDDTLQTDGASVLGVATPVRGVMTQEEFDALPEGERNKGLYFITGPSNVFPESLKDCSWAQISRWSRAGYLKDHYPLWSEKSITLNGAIGNTVFHDLELRAAILGFDHNQEIESPGEHRTHFIAFVSDEKLCGLVDSEYYKEVSGEGYFSFNVGDTTSGGYTKSQLYKNIIPAIKQALPQDLQAVLNPVHKYTYNGSSLEEFVDSVFIPSGAEMFEGYESEAKYGNQKWYLAMGALADTKVYSHTSAKIIFAHLRSIYGNTNTDIIWTDGKLDYGRAGLSAGLIFVFTV